MTPTWRSWAVASPACGLRYYLHQRDPTLRIVVLEAEVVGFGASGRNGGWCSALLPMSPGSMEASHGRDAAIAMQRAMFATVDEVGRAAAAEGIDCHFAKGGYLHLATNPAHTARLHAELAEARRYDLGEDDLRWLDRAEAAQRLAASGVLGALYTPHCAAIHPARLARGLGEVVERAGIVVHEGTPVRSIEQGRVTTDDGTVRAEVVVRATEGFTRTLQGGRRTLVPLYSLMIATEPLPDDVWDGIGLRERETFNDARHLIIYGQRTADGRFAFGGRGAPYHFGSGIRPEFDRDRGVHDSLHRTLRELFPAIGDAAVTHRWGGPLGVPRDWTCSVGLDREQRMAWAGGYVGDGVATTNLAGRTLADLITGQESEPDEPPLGGPPVTALGAGAAALARHQRRAAAPAGRRSRRGSYGAAGPCALVGHRPAARPLTPQPGNGPVTSKVMPRPSVPRCEEKYIRSPAGLNATPVSSLVRWP